MSNTANHPVRPAVVVALAALFLAAVVALSIQVSAADGKAAKLLGETKSTPDPQCPKNCLVAARVTGFQVEADGKRGIFRAPADGRIVAWSVDLGNVKEEDVKSATEKFGGAPTAKLAILRKVKKQRYKLTKQSPSINFESKIGQRPIFTLGKPLRVRKGVRIALTVPHWLPIYREGLNRDDNKWVQSRRPNQCSDSEQGVSKPQKKVGSTRTYGCGFRGERILYWAYFVPSKKS